MRTFKLIILCTSFSILFFVSNVSGERRDIMENDGTDWLNTSESYKGGFVAGFFSGLSIAEIDVKPRETAAFKRFISEKDKNIMKAFEERWNSISLNNITVGQIKDGVDAFYKDFSNRRIKIADVIYVVNMQIKGKDSELIDAQIRYLKMQPIIDEAFSTSFEKWIFFWKEKGHYPTYKEIKNGDFSKEDMLRASYFVDTNNNIHELFRYGWYK